MVTVSEPWAETYRRRYGKPTIVVYNGYDPRDYTIEADAEAAGINGLTIAYTGAIYPGRRDPSALFEALPMMDGGNGWCRVEFYGTNPDHVFPLADKFGVRDLVYVYPRVPRKESLAIQRRSDILLFMQWNDPKEQGNVPGKLFDYLAARRPILGLGLENGVPASIIRERSAGFFCNDPVAIADKLMNWRLLKQTKGVIAPLPISVRTGFSRDDQNGKLERFFRRILTDGGGANA